MNAKTIDNAGSVAVRQLRLKKLKSGLPFMINSKELPKGECYLEFPDRIIKLAKLSIDGKSFEIIRILNNRESESLRKKFKLAD